MIDYAAPAAAQPIGDGAAWGMSTSVDPHERDPIAIRSRERITQYVVELCELIGMRRIGECQVVQFGEGRVAGFFNDPAHRNVTDQRPLRQRL